MNAASQSTHNLSYVLLTAAYNEEHYIEETIRSVVAQVLRPEMWVRKIQGADVLGELLRRLPVPRANGGTGSV